MKMDISSALSQVNNNATAINSLNAGFVSDNNFPSIEAEEYIGQALQREFSFRNSFGYVVGRLVRIAFNKVFPLMRAISSSLPSLRVPVAEANEIEEGNALTLSDEEAMRVLKSKTIILSAPDKKTEATILKRFLRIASQVRSEGQLTKVNFDIFLRYNPESKFVLHVVEDNNFNLGALYNQNTNSVHLKVGLKNKLSWATLSTKLVHEIGHAADDVRSNFPFNMKKSSSHSYHHMDDVDAVISKELVNNCVTTVIKAAEEVNTCLHKRKKCDSGYVKAVKEYNNRPSNLVFATANTLKMARKVVSETVKEGVVVDTPLGRQTVLENRKDCVIFTSDDPATAFSISAMNTLDIMDAIENQQEMYVNLSSEEMKITEKAKCLDELMSNRLKEKLCPKLVDFEQKQNMRFAERVEKEREKMRATQEEREL